jgi:hypothetical protein
MNTRVIAVESFRHGILKYFGWGTLHRDKIPDFAPFNGDMNRTAPDLFPENPEEPVYTRRASIILDSGERVWDFQCWYADEATWLSKYQDDLDEAILLPPPLQIFPMIE